MKESSDQTALADRAASGTAARLSFAEAMEAKARRLAYMQDLAIEGIHLTADEIAFLDRLDAQRVGYDEGVAMVIAELEQRRRGLAPAAE